jgi:hypothetical protein
MHFITILIASSCFSNYSDFFHLEDFDSILPPTVTLRLRAVFAFFFLHFISQKRFEPFKGWEGCTKVENKKETKIKERERLS